MVSYMKRNRNLVVGLILLLIVALFVILGNIFWDTSMADPRSAGRSEHPSWAHPFGSEELGRDLLAVMIVGIPKTLFIGFAGGLIGVTIGTILALVAAYNGGAVDAVIRGIVDIGLTIPALLVLVLFAISLGPLSVSQMVIVVASLAWLFPTRTIRSQVLTIRERSYVQISKLSGASAWETIFKEIMPNLLPYLAATFVATVSAAVLASVGLELLGLSELDSNTLGVTLYWANTKAALLKGMWWWFLPPVITIVIIFIGLFGVASGLDELANPRTRRVV